MDKLEKPLNNHKMKKQSICIFRNVDFIFLQRRKGRVCAI